jgi:hypothetical protein
LVFNSLNNIAQVETARSSKGVRKKGMIMPSRRKLGAIALIAAGLIAVAVPFMLLHGSSPQGTSPNPGTGGNDNNNNNNNGGSKTTTTTTTPGGGTTGTSNSGGNNGNGNGNGSGTESCTGTKSSDPKTADPDHDNGNGKDNGNAYGLVKNKVDNTVALMKAMGKSNPAFHLHHDTDTDNDSAHGHHHIHDPGDHDSSCAAGEEKHEQS